VKIEIFFGKERRPSMKGDFPTRSSY